MLIVSTYSFQVSSTAPEVYIIDINMWTWYRLVISVTSTLSTPFMLERVGFWLSQQRMHRKRVNLSMRWMLAMWRRRIYYRYLASGRDVGENGPLVPLCYLLYIFERSLRPKKATKPRDCPTYGGGGYLNTKRNRELVKFANFEYKRLFEARCKPLWKRWSLGC